MLTLQLKLEVDERVEPVQLPKRRVPVALYKPHKEELSGLEKSMIKAVEKSTDWISSQIVVKKPSGTLSEY
jgi:hypothetical protein